MSTKKNKTYKSQRNTQSFIPAAFKKSKLFSSIGVKNPTLDSFKDFLGKKMNELKKVAGSSNSSKLTPMYCGGICLQQLIIEKLNKLKSKNINKKQLDNRLSYFKSDVFIKNFTNMIPTRDNVNKSALETSYSAFFNDLFNVNYKGWRDEKLSKNNQLQCLRALSLAPSTKIVDLQEVGKITCYLCGRKILSSLKGINSTMECEHILPVITALSHWWLVKDKNHTSAEIQNLAYEYDWSHRCCNQLKSNIDFIVYDASRSGRFEYKVNMEMIKYVLDKIKNDGTYDCPKIQPKKIDPKQNENIARRIQPIIDEINANALQFNTHSEYLLLTKYKVLSALTDDDFLQSIIGSDDNTTTTNNKIQIPKRKDIQQIIKEKRELLIRLKAEEIQRKELNIKMQKQLRDFRAINRNRTGGGFDFEIDELTNDEILEYDLPEYNEFEDFNSKFIIREILTNKRFDPTLKELTDTFEKIFIHNTYIQWDPNTDAAHSYFVETNKAPIATRNKLHGLLPKNDININTQNPTHRTTLTRNYTSTELEKMKKTGLLPKDILKKDSTSSSSSSSSRTRKKRRII
jgi:hypothetical protein